MGLSSVHQHNPDCDIWVHEYFTPSWFCLPNNQPALTVIRPGDTSRDVLEMICKVNLPWGAGRAGQPPGPVPGLPCTGTPALCQEKSTDCTTVLGQERSRTFPAAETSSRLRFAFLTLAAVHEPGRAFTGWLCCACAAAFDRASLALSLQWD